MLEARSQGFHLDSISPLQMSAWQEAMSSADANGDGSLSFLEFQDAIKMAETAVCAAMNGKEA